ncbi:hypothetical protein D3C79_775790 [compost metagenome]
MNAAVAFVGIAQVEALLPVLKLVRNSELDGVGSPCLDGGLRYLAAKLQAGIERGAIRAKHDQIQPRHPVNDALAHHLGQQGVVQSRQGDAQLGRRGGDLFFLGTDRPQSTDPVIHLTTQHQLPQAGVKATHAAHQIQLERIERCHVGLIEGGDHIRIKAGDHG